VTTLVVVEGASDRAALEALAQRRGRDLAAEGVSVVPIGGAHGIGAFLRRLGPRTRELRLAGLCDAGEERHFRQALEHAGLGAALDRAGLERLGFFVCEADLEDELIRALGPVSVVQVIEAQGDLRSFRTFQQQPAQRQVPLVRQLRRFMGTRSGRKEAYARLLVDALDPAQVPPPLERLLAHL
jgi:hypothetical protein